jgi:hypothetical protein
MAQIKIRVPSIWPDFFVTSHHRPGDKGSHGTVGGAIDIQPDWPGSWDKSSPVWFYYYQTFMLLIAAQRHGMLRLAIPPDCPHFHISTNKTYARFGAELVQPRTIVKNGKKKKICKTILWWDVDNRKHIERLDGMRKIRDVLGQKYWANISNRWQELKYKFQSNDKYITVKPLPGPNGISDKELQTMLDDLFGDGSLSQYIKDQASQLIGFVDKDDAKANLPSLEGIGILAALAVGAFFLLRGKD